MQAKQYINTMNIYGKWLLHIIRVIRRLTPLCPTLLANYSRCRIIVHDGYIIVARQLSIYHVGIQMIMHFEMKCYNDPFLKSVQVLVKYWRRSRKPDKSVVIA